MKKINTTKIKQFFLGLFLIGVGVISTYAYMTIQHLQEGTAQLEERVEELKTTKVILEAVQEQLEEEGEKLSKGEALK